MLKEKKLVKSITEFLCLLNIGLIVPYSLEESKWNGKKSIL